MAPYDQLYVGFQMLSPRIYFVSWNKAVLFGVLQYVRISERLQKPGWDTYWDPRCWVSQIHSLILRNNTVHKHSLDKYEYEAFLQKTCLQTTLQILSV